MSHQGESSGSSKHKLTPDERAAIRQLNDELHHAAQREIYKDAVTNKPHMPAAGEGDGDDNVASELEELYQHATRPETKEEFEYESTRVIRISDPGAEEMLLEEARKRSVQIKPQLPRRPWIESGDGINYHQGSASDYDLSKDPVMTPIMYAEYLEVQERLQTMQLNESGIYMYKPGQGPKRKNKNTSNKRPREFDQQQQQQQRFTGGKRSYSQYQHYGRSSSSSNNDYEDDRTNTYAYQDFDYNAPSNPYFQEQQQQQQQQQLGFNYDAAKEIQDEENESCRWIYSKLRTNNQFLKYSYRPENPYDYVARNEQLHLFHLAYDYIVEGDADSYVKGRPTDGIPCDQRLKIIMHGKDAPGNRIACKVWGFQPYLRFRVPLQWYDEPDIDDEEIAKRLNVMMMRLEQALKDLVNQRMGWWKIKNILKLPLLVEHPQGQGWESGNLISSWSFLSENWIRTFENFQPRGIKHYGVELKVVHPKLIPYVAELLTLNPNTGCDSWFRFDSDQHNGLRLYGEPGGTDVLRHEFPWEHFHSYEAEIKLHTRMRMDLRMEPSSWVIVQKEQFTVVTDPQRRSTLADLEVECHYTALKNIDDTALVSDLPTVMTPAMNAAADKMEMKLNSFMPDIETMLFDIEVIVPRDGTFPQACKDPINKISVIHFSSLSEQKNEMQFGLGHIKRPASDSEDLTDQAQLQQQQVKKSDTGNPMDDGEIIPQHVFTYDSEKEMLRNWLRYVQTAQAENIAGWNSNRFDWAYIYNRCLLLGLDEVCYLGALPDERMNIRAVRKIAKSITVVNIPGSTIIDMMYTVADMYKLRSYTLAYACSRLLSTDDTEINKLDMSHDLIRYFQLTPEGRWYLGEYCGQDVRVLYYLWNKIKLLTVNMSLSNWTKTSIQEALDHGMLLTAYHSTIWACLVEGPGIYGIGVLVLISSKGPEMEVVYEGAIVLPPKRGFYELVVITLDFASMYPSIMIAYNVCLSTFIGMKDIVRWGYKEGVEYFRLPKPVQDPKTRRVTMVYDPEGHCFIRKEICQGIIPIAQTGLMGKRGGVKRQMGAPKNQIEKNDKDIASMKLQLKSGNLSQELMEEVTRELARIVAINSSVKFFLNWLDACQNIAKVIMNGWYGATGQTHSLICCPPVASTITAAGRYLISFTADYLDTKYNRRGLEVELDVIYGDTDSVMLACNFRDIESSPEFLASDRLGRRKMLVARGKVFGDILAKEMNEEYKKLTPDGNDAMKVNFEKVYYPMALFDCKMYAAYKYDGPTKEEFVEMKGLCTKRRDTAPLTIESVDEFTEHAFKFMDQQAAEDSARGNFSRLISGKINPSKFVLSKSSSKQKLEDYTQMSAHLAVMLRNRERAGIQVSKGDRVSFIMVKPIYSSSETREKDIKRSEQSEDCYYAACNRIPPDLEYYRGALWKKLGPLMHITRHPITKISEPPKGTQAARMMNATIPTTGGVIAAAFMRAAQTSSVASCYMNIDQESLDRQKKQFDTEIREMERQFFADPKMRITTPSYMTLISEFKNIQSVKEHSGDQHKFASAHKKRDQQLGSGKLLTQVMNKNKSSAVSATATKRCYSCKCLLPKPRLDEPEGQMMFCPRCVSRGKDLVYFDDMLRDVKEATESVVNCWKKCDVCVRRTRIKDQATLDSIARGCANQMCDNLYDRLSWQHKTEDMVDSFKKLRTLHKSSGTGTGASETDKRVTEIRELIVDAGYETRLNW